MLSSKISKKKWRQRERGGEEKEKEKEEEEEERLKIRADVRLTQSSLRRVDPQKWKWWTLEYRTREFPIEVYFWARKSHPKLKRERERKKIEEKSGGKKEIEGERAEKGRKRRRKSKGIGKLREREELPKKSSSDLLPFLVGFYQFSHRPLTEFLQDRLGFVGTRSISRDLIYLTRVEPEKERGRSRDGVGMESGWSRDGVGLGSAFIYCTFKLSIGSSFSILIELTFRQSWHLVKSRCAMLLAIEISQSRCLAMS